MKRRFAVGTVLTVALVGAAALLLSGVASGKSSVTPLPSSSCGQIFYQGGGSPDYIIATDLPLQGAGRAQLLAMGQAVRYVLSEQYKFKAGKYKIGYQECDDSTAQKGAWDSAKCTANARNYANNKAVVAVLGTFNSGCAKLELPILNRAPGGAVAMLSTANTAVGLTHNASWNDPGEPGIYYPTGIRNYARVSASDDYQGPAAADLLKQLAQGQVGVRDPRQPDVRQGRRERVPSAGAEARDQGARLRAWDPQATDYTAIGQKIKDSGAQSVTSAASSATTASSC